MKIKKTQKGKYSKNTRTWCKNIAVLPQKKKKKNKQILSKTKRQQGKNLEYGNRLHQVLVYTRNKKLLQQNF